MPLKQELLRMMYGAGDSEPRPEYDGKSKCPDCGQIHGAVVEYPSWNHQPLNNINGNINDGWRRADYGVLGQPVPVQPRQEGFIEVAQRIIADDVRARMQDFMQYEPYPGVIERRPPPPPLGPEPDMR